MTQNCSISPSLCVLCGNFEIRHTLKLNFPPFSLRNRFISSGQKDTQCFSLFSLAFNNGFNGTNLRILRVCHSFQKCSFAVTGVWLSRVFHLWVLTLQNLFYSGFPHPATNPSWTAKPEPCKFVWSAVSVDGTLYDAMLKGLHKNIGS